MRAFEGAVQRAHTVIVARARRMPGSRCPPAAGTGRCSISAVLCSSSPRRAGSSRRSMSCWTAMAPCCPKSEYAALEAECAAGAEKICQTLLAAAAERHTRGDDRHAHGIHAEQTTRAARRHAAAARAQAHLRGERHAAPVHLRGEARAMSARRHRQPRQRSGAVAVAHRARGAARRGAGARLAFGHHGHHHARRSSTSRRISPAAWRRASSRASSRSRCSTGASTWWCTRSRICPRPSPRGSRIAPSCRAPAPPTGC